MAHTILTKSSRLPEIIDRLTKRYESKGITAQDARRRATAEVEERASGVVGAGFGKGLGIRRSASRNKGPSRAMEVKNRSDKEKREAAMRKPSHQKSPGQKTIRGDTRRIQP